MFGAIEPKQLEVLCGLVAGKSVWDLGCGPDLAEARLLTSLGAREVYAVDKHGRNNSMVPRFSRLVDGTSGVIVDCQAYFDEFSSFLERAGLSEGPDVAFIKWPTVNGGFGLTQLVSRAPKVVYIGLNDGLTACGSRSLWEHFKARKLETVVEGAGGSLLVYGAPCAPALEPRCKEEMEAGGSW